MKRMVCAVLAVVMLAAGVAWAEEDLHLLWGIEFGQDMIEVQRILKNEFGLEMKYHNGELAGSQTESLDCQNVDKMTILGYPVSSFYWYVGTEDDSREEIIRISFSEREVSELYEVSPNGETSILPLADILSVLVEQFGPIDFAIYQVFSEGAFARLMQKKDNIYELGHFSDLDINSLNLRTILDTTDYLTENSAISLNIVIDNICLYCATAGTSGKYEIAVSFRNSVYLDTYEDAYEEFKIVEYEDKGF